jgi:hypothetical protein
MAQRKQSHRGAASKVAQYLVKREGKLVYVQELQKDLGLDQRQAQNALYYVKAHTEVGKGVEVIQRGAIYRYVAPRNGEGRVFEQLATTKDGHLILQDEEGNLYRAEQL